MLFVCCCLALTHGDRSFTCVPALRVGAYVAVCLRHPWLVHWCRRRHAIELLLYAQQTPTETRVTVMVMVVRWCCQGLVLSVHLLCAVTGLMGRSGLVLLVGLFLPGG